MERLVEVFQFYFYLTLFASNNLVSCILRHAATQRLRDDKCWTQSSRNQPVRTCPRPDHLSIWHVALRPERNVMMTFFTRRRPTCTGTLSDVVGYMSSWATFFLPIIRSCWVSTQKTKVSPLTMRWRLRKWWTLTSKWQFLDLDYSLFHKNKTRQTWYIYMHFLNMRATIVPLFEGTELSTCSQR